MRPIRCVMATKMIGDRSRLSKRQRRRRKRRVVTQVGGIGGGVQLDMVVGTAMEAETGGLTVAGVMADTSLGIGRQERNRLVTALQERGQNVSHMWEEGTYQSGLPSLKRH